jgi:uncharacterized protein YoxC
MTDRNSNDKLDSLMSEVVKMSVAVAEMSKEVHSVNNRMTGLEVVLNGIGGKGGIVSDISNMGEKLSKQGMDIHSIDNKVSIIETSHKDLKENVREQAEKIKTLFIENNQNKINSAGISAKMASIMGVISAGMAAIVGLAIKYLETK